jgi:hypothetical protein
MDILFLSFILFYFLYSVPFVFIAGFHSHYLYMFWYLDMLLASRLRHGMLTELSRNNSDCPYEYLKYVVYNSLLYTA